jgi:hypothetical protein
MVLAFAATKVLAIEGWRRRVVLAFATAIVALHFVVGPKGAFEFRRGYQWANEKPTSLLSADVLPAQTSRAVVLWWPQADDSLRLRTKMAGQHPKLDAFWYLTMTDHACSVTRSGDRSLLFATAGSLIPGDASRGAAALRNGTEIAMSGLRIRVLEAENGVIKRALFEFEQAFDSDDLVLLAYRDGGLRRVAAPPMGETVHFRLKRPAS